MDAVCPVRADFSTRESTSGGDPPLTGRLSAMVEPSGWSSWNLEPLQLVPTVLAAVLYARRAQTLARRGTPVPGWRQGLFWTGILLVVLALNSPIDALGEEQFFWIHMLQHVLIGDLAPLCFVAGLTGPI